MKLETYTFTPEELAENMNNAVFAVAQRMVMDGLIQNVEQVTDRYLVLVVRKGRIARMFESLFDADDKEDMAKIAVVRVDNTVKANDNK